MNQKHVLTFAILLIFITPTYISQAAFSAPFSSPISIMTDKQFYAPGQEVTVTIDSQLPFQQGQVIELSVLEGSRIGHIVIYKTHEITEVGTSSAMLKFTPPNQSPFPVYFIRIVIHNAEGTNYAAEDIPIYTQQGADVLVITDFQIDRTEVVQGGYVEFSYNVRDGTGKPFLGATSNIGICDDSSTNMPSYYSLTPDFPPKAERSDPAYAGCTLFYSSMASPSDSFNFKFGIPTNVDPGMYKLKVWASDPLRDTAHVSSVLAVTQRTDDANSTGSKEYWDLPFTQSVQYLVSKNPGLPDFESKFLVNLSENQRKLLLSPGQNITFFGYQVGGTEGTILGTLRGLHGYERGGFAGSAYEDVSVRIYIISPDGNRVFDREVLTDSNGSFEETTFGITPDLPQGLYEIYYDVETPDGLYVPVGGGTYYGIDAFFVSNLQGFKVDTSVNKTFDVYFQGVGMNASNLRFDEENKTLQFDIDRMDGNYYNIHSFFTYPLIDCPQITIEEPLLTGPFKVSLNENGSWFCGGESSRITNSVGPILEDSSVVVTGTYVIPEFNSLGLIVVGSVGLTAATIVARYVSIRRNP